MDTIPSTFDFTQWKRTRKTTRSRRANLEKAEMKRQKDKPMRSELRIRIKRWCHTGGERSLATYCISFVFPERTTRQQKAILIRSELRLKFQMWRRKTQQSLTAEPQTHKTNWKIKTRYGEYGYLMEARVLRKLNNTWKNLCQIYRKPMQNNQSPVPRRPFTVWLLSNGRMMSQWTSWARTTQSKANFTLVHWLSVWKRR